MIEFLEMIGVPMLAAILGYALCYIFEHVKSDDRAAMDYREMERLSNEICKRDDFIEDLTNSLNTCKGWNTKYREDIEHLEGANRELIAKLTQKHESRENQKAPESNDN